jgi:hypothetical protein
MLKYNLVTYANTKYQERQFNLINYAKNLNIFDQLFFYSDSWLKKTEYYKKNKFILDQERGGGFWCWKPYVIYETLNKLNNNDVAFYIDCGDIFSKNIIEYVNPILEKENCLLLGGGFPNKCYTKRDVFFLMQCDLPEFHNVIQLECGIQMWKKTDISMKIIEEWMHYSQDYRIITDAPNECGLENYNTFIDNRHDQSILTNLFVKYKLPVDSPNPNFYDTPYRGLRNYVQCNMF